METSTLRHHTRLSVGLALILGTTMLAACSSGSGALRAGVPPSSPPPPPPGPTSVQGPLIVDGTVYQNAPVNGDVRINAGGNLSLDANVSGSVANEGRMEVWNPSLIETNSHVRIGGSYAQSPAATLMVHLGGPEASDLRIAGNASLAGTLQIALPYGGNFDPYNENSFSLTPNILHADGNINGQFDKVVLPSVFVSGTTSYGAHDVTMALAKVPAASVAGAGADAITVAGAIALDAVVDRIGWNGSPGSIAPTSQRQFNASLQALWHTDNATQAARSFDSLSGHAYASTRAWLLDAGDTAALRRELPSRPVRDGVNAWWRDRSALNAHADAGAMAAQSQSEGARVGMDRWLGERLLLGIAAGEERTHVNFIRGDDRMQWQRPSALVYAQYRHGAWHAAGVLGQSQARLEMQRWIDLGTGGRHLAGATLDFERFDATFEAGRDLHVGDGTIVLYVGVHHVALRSDGFIERGDTGFELTAAPARLARTSADLGMRFAHAWRLDGDRLLALRVDGDWKHYLDRADPWQVGYTGLPSLRFDLPEPAIGPNQQYLDMQLQLGGRRENDWSVFLHGSWNHNDIEHDLAWQFGALKRF